VGPDQLGPCTSEHEKRGQQDLHAQSSVLVRRPGLISEGRYQAITIDRLAEELQVSEPTV
jgi:hypothetical protein